MQSIEREVRKLRNEIDKDMLINEAEHAIEAKGRIQGVNAEKRKEAIEKCRQIIDGNNDST